MTLPYVKNDYKSGPLKRAAVRVSASADALFTLPKYHAVRAIFIDEVAGAAVTGGIDIGTSVGGQQLLAAEAVGANASVDAAPVASLYTNADDELSITAATAWNGATVDVVLICDVMSAGDETV